MIFLESNRTYMRQFSVGLCWIQLGMLQSTLLRPVGVLDPVEETNFKVDSMNEEVSSSLHLTLFYLKKND